MLIPGVGSIKVAHCDYRNRSCINADIINKVFYMMLAPNHLHLPLLFTIDNNTNHRCFLSFVNRHRSSTITLLQTKYIKLERLHSNISARQQP